MKAGVGVEFSAQSRAEVYIRIEKMLVDQVGVSSISLAEMVHLSEKGRISASAVQDLIRNLFDPEFALHGLPVDASIAQQMAAINRDEVPDTLDRMVATHGPGECSGNPGSQILSSRHPDAIAAMKQFLIFAQSVLGAPAQKNKEEIA